MSLGLICILLGIVLAVISFFVNANQGLLAAAIILVGVGALIGESVSF